jgi:tryprostatin B 6-hydroxylase
LGFDFPFFESLPEYSVIPTRLFNSILNIDLIMDKFHAESAMSFVAERPLLARCALVGVFGILVHHIVFINNEWHMQGPRIIKTVIAAYAVLALLEARKTLSVAALGHAGLIVGSFVSCLLLSIAAYRLFAHRTRHFPGPRLAGLTKLWHMYQCRNGQNHLVLERMHREYGEFVRTGPNEITVFHPIGLSLLDGPGSKTSKSVWYDFLLPNVGVTTIRDRGWHDQRRRLWIKGFSTSAMEKYQQHIENHAKDMDAIIASAKGSPVPISTYIYWFSFDIMGLFAFSRSFDMIHSEHWHYSIRNLRKAMTLLGPFSCVPWAAQIGFWLLKGYWVVRDWDNMIAWCANQMQLRLDVCLVLLTLPSSTSHVGVEGYWAELADIPHFHRNLIPTTWRRGSSKTPERGVH